MNVPCAAEFKSFFFKGNWFKHKQVQLSPVKKVVIK